MSEKEHHGWRLGVEARRRVSPSKRGARACDERNIEEMGALRRAYQDSRKHKGVKAKDSETATEKRDERVVYRSLIFEGMGGGKRDG